MSKYFSHIFSNIFLGVKGAQGTPGIPGMMGSPVG